MKKSTVKKHFTDFAEDWIRASYDGDGYAYPTARHRTGVVCSILSELQAPSRVTDLGCGGGHLAGRLAQMGHNVTAVDQSAEMIRLASEHVAGLDTETAARVSFRQAELEHLADGAGDQDAVTSMGVIGYLDDDQPMFDAANGQLRDGGLFLLSCRNRLFNMASISFRTHREIADGSAGALLEEMVAHSQGIAADDLKTFAEGLISAGEELLKIASKDQPAPPAAAPVDRAETPEIEPRQHTPAGIRDTAQQNGFEMVGLHGVHPHLLPPHMRKAMPPHAYNLLSSTLEPLHAQPASVCWSSVFIAVLKKTG